MYNYIKSDLRASTSLIRTIKLGYHDTKPSISE